MSEMFKVLRNRTVLQVSALMMFFNMFNSMCTSIQILYYLDLGATIFQVNLITSINSAMSIIEIPLGMISDRYGRKFVLVIVRICILCSLAIQSFATEPNHLIVAAVVGVSAALGFLAVFSTMIMDVTEKDERRQALSIFYLLASVGLLAGPALTTVLLQYHLVGLRNIYQIATVYMIFDVIYCIFIVKETLSKSSQIISYREHFSNVLKRHSIQALLLTSAIYALSTTILTTYVPINARKNLAFTDSEVASLSLVRSLAMVAIRFATASFLAKLPTKKYLMGVIAIAGVADLLSSQAGNYPTLILIFLLEGTAYGAVRILFTTLLGENTSPEHRGTANSLYHITESTSQATKIVTTPIAETQGYPTVLILGGVLAFTSLISALSI